MLRPPTKKHSIIRRRFFKHYAVNVILGMIISMVFLLVGMVGLGYYEHASWIDAYANAAMIMSGVGPISNPQTFGGKLFIGTYSLLSGMGFLVVIGIVFAPVFRWLFHHVHMEEED